MGSVNTVNTVLHAFNQSVGCLESDSTSYDSYILIHLEYNFAFWTQIYRLSSLMKVESIFTIRNACFQVKLVDVLNM